MVGNLEIRIKSLRFLYGFDLFFISKASFKLMSMEKDTILRIFLDIYDQADCFTKNFGGQSRRPITKKLRNQPIMFGFGHSLAA